MVDRRAAVDRDLGVDGGQTTTIGLSSARPAVSRVCRDRRIAGYRYATPVDEQTASLSEATVEARTTATAEERQRCARDVNAAALGVAAASDPGAARGAHRTVLQVDIVERE